MLPIVQRELLVAARKPATGWIRTLTAFSAILVGFFFVFSFFFFGRIFPNIGVRIFNMFSWLSMALSLLAGVLLAADSISSEKREGTLGLLFLTDLTGFDVLAGKFFSVGLNAFYGMLAMLPVFSIPFMLGGTSGGEFFRVSLATVNIFFFAITAGLLASVLCRESFQAMGMTCAIEILVMFCLPGLGRLALLAGIPILADRFSPFTAFTAAFSSSYDAAPGRFYESLGCSVFLSLALLALACRRLPELSGEPVPKDAVKRGAFFRRFWRKAAAPLLDGEPVVWLVSRNRWVALTARCIAVTAGCATVALAFALRKNARVFQEVIAPMLSFCMLLFKLLLAYQACWLYSESRRTGALELIGCTPLKSGEMIDGQWKVLVKIFVAPVTAVFCMQMFALFMDSVLLRHPLLTFSMAAPSGTILSVTFNFFLYGSQLSMIGGMVPQPFFLAAGFAALGWMGMWIGLSARKPGGAYALTILVAMILPGIALCVPRIMIDVFFIVWAAVKLRQDFRRRIVAQSGDAPGEMPPASGLVTAPGETN